MSRLVCVQGYLSGTVVELNEPQILFGRGDECHVLFPPESGASRKHARMVREESGGWILEDLGSSHGTSVRGERIGSPTLLAAGDVIVIGTETFDFYLEEATGAPEPAPQPQETAERVKESSAVPPGPLSGPDTASGKPLGSEVDTSSKGSDSPAQDAQTASEPPPPTGLPPSVDEKPPALPTPPAAASETPVPSGKESASETPPPAEPGAQELVSRMSSLTETIRQEIGKAIVGQVDIVMDLLTAIISRGHVLLIGMPGLAKTTLVRTVSEVLDLDFRRIQFTPDLMPSDITGTDILEVDEVTGKKEYRFVKGPIFTQILLADEINRTPPKTQAALLEAMQEYRVTASGRTYDLAAPFFVLATQNPLEQEGTYPLPEAQLDRFMFSIFVDYPNEEEERKIAKVTTSTLKTVLNKVMSGGQILELQKTVRELPISDHVLNYTVRLVRSTRPADKHAPDFIKKWIHCGSGPRAAQNILVAAKARAVIAGRLVVTSEDVRSVARPVLRHRIFTNFAADSEGMDADKIVARLVETVAEPGPSEY
jgi:MoxR-like ATPase